MIRCDWEVKEGIATIEIEIPANTTATIELNQVGAILSTNLSVNVNGEKVTVRIGSGFYTISYEIA